MNFLHSRRNVEILGATKLHARFVSIQKKMARKIDADSKSPQLSILEGWFLPTFFAKDPTDNSCDPLQTNQGTWRSEVHALAWQRSGSSGSDPGVLDQQKTGKPVLQPKIPSKPMGKFHGNQQLGVSECNLASSDLKVGRVSFSGPFLVALPLVTWNQCNPSNLEAILLRLKVCPRSLLGCWCSGSLANVPFIKLYQGLEHKIYIYASTRNARKKTPITNNHQKHSKCRCISCAPKEQCPPER